MAGWSESSRPDRQVQWVAAALSQGCHAVKGMPERLIRLQESTMKACMAEAVGRLIISTSS